MCYFTEPIRKYIHMTKKAIDWVYYVFGLIMVKDILTMSFYLAMQKQKTSYFLHRMGKKHGWIGPNTMTKMTWLRKETTIINNVGGCWMLFSAANFHFWFWSSKKTSSMHYHEVLFKKLWIGSHLPDFSILQILLLNNLRFKNRIKLSSLERQINFWLIIGAFSR